VANGASSANVTFELTATTMPCSGKVGHVALHRRVQLERAARDQQAHARRGERRIAGGLEGAVIGFAVAAGLVLGGGVEALRPGRPATFAALTTGLAGALVPLAGGSMMASSLARVAASFDGSRLDMAPLGELFGEPELGAVAQSALGALEGAIFGGCVVAALLIARRRVPRG